MVFVPPELVGLTRVSVVPVILPISSQSPPRPDVIKGGAWKTSGLEALDGRVQLQQGDVIAAIGAISSTSFVAVSVSDGSLDAPLLNTTSL